MSQLRNYELLGLTDPGAMSLGFLIALFTDGRSNAPLVQRIVGGSVEGFEPYEVPDAPMISLPAPIPEIYLRVGDAALHAFAFGKGDVALVRNLAEREALADRIGDPALLDRPLVAMELASFIGRNDLRVELGRKVYENLQKVSLKSANQWRDLSILTSELRQRLSAREELRAELLSETIVASVDRDVVVLRAVGAIVGPEIRSMLRKEALDALAQLGPLYPRREHWTIEVREGRRKEARRDHDAAILLASDGARNLMRRHIWPAVPDVEVFSEDGLEFTRRVENTAVPLFVVYDAKEPGVMRRATGDWTVREMHGIALGQPPRPLARKDESSEFWAGTFIPRPGIRSIGGSDRNVIQGIQLAIAAELDRTAAHLSPSVRKSVLLRATGAGPNPRGDAWASLYDRAWDMGLDPVRGIRLPRPNSRADDSFDAEHDWVEHALFGDSPALVKARVATVMEETRTTAAILVEAAPRADNHIGLRRAVTSLAGRQGWSIHDADSSSPTAPLMLVGRVDIPVKFKLAKEYASEIEMPPMDIDLRFLDGIALLGGAGAGSILAGIRSHRLLVVALRDLVTFPADSSTILSLVGNQLQRQVTGLPSGSRTKYLAMVVAQAFHGGNIKSGLGSQIEAAINDASLGERLHLVLSNVRRLEDGVFAQVRLLDDSRAPPGGPISREVGRFGIVVQPHEVALVDAGIHP